jgi:hypothetical protein
MGIIGEDFSKRSQHLFRVGIAKAQRIEIARASVRIIEGQGIFVLRGLVASAFSVRWRFQAPPRSSSLLSAVVGPGSVGSR